MSALDSLGKSIGEVIDERMSSPLISSFAIAWAMINYKFFVILFSDTPVKQTFLLIQEICFPDTWSWILKGLLYPLAAAMAYLFLLPKPSQFVYEHWRKLQKWKNDTNYKYDSDAYETLAKSRAQRERIAEISDELKKLNAENEQMRLDAKDRIKEISDLKARTVGEEVDALKDLLHHVTEEREEYKIEMERSLDELQKLTEKHALENAELVRTVEVRQAERAKLQQHLSEMQSERAVFQKQIEELRVALQTSEINMAELEAERRKAVTEVEAVLAKSQVEIESNPTQSEIIRTLVKEGLVQPPFDDDELLVLQGVANNRGHTSRQLYELIDLSPVNIDYCLVELAELGFLFSRADNEYDDPSYELTQLGRRIVVRAQNLQLIY